MIGGLSRKVDTQEFEFWSKLGVDFIELSVAFDFFFDQEKVTQALDLKHEYGLNLLIHPNANGQILLSPANPDAHDRIFESLEIMAQLIRQHNLINQIIMHLATYRIPSSGKKSFSKEQAIENSQIFYEKLNHLNDIAIVLENVYPPGKGWEELGYKAEHFGLFGLGDGFECL